MLKETIKYLDDNFSTWRKSPFLKFTYSIKKGFKHIGLWGISIMYKMNLSMLFIKSSLLFLKSLSSAIILICYRPLVSIIA